jgi:hypothetical protein
MDDQSGDRQGDIRAKPGFQIGLSRLFGAVFWVCVFFGALSWLISQGERLHNAIEQHGVAGGLRQDKTALFYALMAALLFTSSFFAIASLVSWFRSRTQR